MQLGRRRIRWFDWWTLALWAGLALINIINARTANAVVNETGASGSPFVVTGQLEVRFTPETPLSGAVRSFGRMATGTPSVDAVFQRHQVSAMRPVFPWRGETSQHEADRRLSRYQIIEFPETGDPDLIIHELLATGAVVSVEKIWAHPLAVVTPDDPQWNLQYAPAIIGANAVWEVEPGSDTAKLAMLDSGVNYKHEDLRDKVWVNPGEDLDGDEEVYDLDDMNGIDDDGNGLVDDLIGYDFFSGFGGLGVWAGEDGAGPDNDPNDFHGHGTHCAGIAAAATNNALGVAGIAGGAEANNLYWSRGPRIMCVRIGAKASDGLGYVTMSAAAAGIDYAARMGADVISCSWGSSLTGALGAAVLLAHDSGVVIAKAAGNSNTSETPDDWMNLTSQVIAVASTNSSDQRSGFSNFGEWVEIAAPGSGIRSTVSFSYTPSYSYMSGTSMATPAYAGAALLIKSLVPGWTKTEIDSILLATAHNIDAENPTYVGLLGAGRVDVNAAIQDLPLALFSAGPTLLGSPGLTVDFTDLSPNSPSAWTWSFGDGDSSALQSP
ncbi:MAG TPA: S8 family serine peptidase, partial [candidate division Zixibacteria bacterium]|nr:S8 family serine peptidase [candidate division Zixibacteria bacterium]